MPLFWTGGNSDDCLPLTGVMGSLREATVAESSSLSSGMEVVSSVGYCSGEEEALEESGQGGSVERAGVELSCSLCFGVFEFLGSREEVVV